MEEREEREYGPEDLLEYKPGDVVPKSGVYRFVHDPDHAHPHDEPEEINAVKGELFPTCRHCRDGRAKILDNAFNVAGIEQFQV
jgi:hypothetical protein